MNNNQYGSVITEQGDLGLGVFPIHEETKEEKENKKEEEK